MKTASDFRAIARHALRGVWTMAVIMGILASLMGGSSVSSGPEINVNFDGGDFSASVEMAGQTLASFGGRHHAAAQGGSGLFGRIAIAGFLVYAIIGAILLGVLYFILGSVIRVGYACFNLDLIERRQLSYSTLFNYFPYWKTAAWAGFLQAVYIFCWSLLLIIPGIIAAYSYAMVPYLLAEHPQLDANEALERSRAMMRGNRARLFGLHLSFIGWDILATLALGIGHLWLTPYKEAANAAFYCELRGFIPGSAADSDPAWTI